MWSQTRRLLIPSTARAPLSDTDGAARPFVAVPLDAERTALSVGFLPLGNDGQPAAVDAVHCLLLLDDGSAAAETPSWGLHTFALAPGDSIVIDTGGLATRRVVAALVGAGAASVGYSWTLVVGEHGDTGGPTGKTC